MSIKECPLAKPTPVGVAGQMLSLKRNFGRSADPASRPNGFGEKVSGCIEFGSVQRSDKTQVDFEFLNTSGIGQFDTIIGEPPFCGAREYELVANESSLLDKRANSYVRFIERSIDALAIGGEMIFFTSKSFLRASGCALLNEKLFDKGTITHFFDLGDRVFYDGEHQNSMVWRFEKGDYSRKTVTLHGDRQFVCSSGQLLFIESGVKRLRIGDLFSVRVGAISGANEIFASEEHGNVEFVVSSTARDGKTRRMIWCPEGPTAYLEGFKAELSARRVAKFNEKTWWHWGRTECLSDEPRIYVNERSRHKKPFFEHPCKRYDSSVLALFPKNQLICTSRSVDVLNEVDWGGLGFTNDGRFMFSQKALEDAIVPLELKDFSKVET
jgi:adenine-specific DNA-methyltransferase